MVLSDNQVHYFISYAVAFVAFGLIARWYLWPTVRDEAPRRALTPLLLYASFRVNGLMFLMPGIVSTQLPKAFAIPTAYGDLTAAALALLALWPIRAQKTAAMSYYLAAINVPAMVVVHVVIFAYLVRHRGGAKQ